MHTFSHCLPLACAELDFPDKLSHEQNTGKPDVVSDTKWSCLTLLPIFGEFVMRKTDIFLSVSQGMLKKFSLFFCFVYLMKLTILCIYFYLSVYLCVCFVYECKRIVQIK